MKILKLILISFFILLAGCTAISDKAALSLGYGKIQDFNNKIAQVQADEKNQEESLKKQIEDVKVDLTNINLQKNTLASNHVFTIRMTYNLIPDPSDYDQIINNEASAAALTLPAPDMAVVETQMTKVKQMLADKTNLAANLKNQLDNATKQAKDLNDKETNDQKAISDLNDQKNKVQKTAQDQISNLETQKDVATKDALSKAQDLLNNKAEWDALKMKITWIVGALSLVALAAAIYSPVLKIQSAVLAGAFGLIAIGIQFVTPAYIGWGIAGVVAIIGIAWLIQHSMHSSTIKTLNTTINSNSATTATPINK